MNQVRLSLDVPDANPVPVAINDAGAIRGNFLAKGGRPRTFLLARRGIPDLARGRGNDLRLAQFPRASRWAPAGSDRVERSVLLDDKDKPTLIEWPGTTLTQARAINDQGVIVGVYLNVDDPKFGLHRSSSATPRASCLRSISPVPGKPR